MFIGAFIAHVTLKFGTMRRSLRTRADVLEAVTPGAVATPIRFRPRPSRSLARRRPRPPTMSRRALLGTVGAGVAPARLQGAAQSRRRAVSRPWRSCSRAGASAPGPLGFPVNKTAVAAGISAHERRGRLAAARWSANGPVSLSREQLLALPQHTYDLPIACVEGWSTTQRWSGVRLRDLAALCGVTGPATVTTKSLEHGTFGHATLGHEQVADERSLLALRVNGLDLSLDHGYPARVISPAVPGVHCTKWVPRMTFRRVHGMTRCDASRSRYGAGPLHLLALLASFAIAGRRGGGLVSATPRRRSTCWSGSRRRS